MKLNELYALACGAKIDKQELMETFYPLASPKYVLIHASSGMQSKNYDYYHLVLELLLPALKSANIDVVQIGGEKDAALAGCINLQGKTTIHQTNYLLARAELLLGNDSWTAHRAGELNIPLVTLFGATSIANHSPYRFNPDKTIFIESHRNGGKPSFATQEPKKTINLIPPEQVANAVLKLLNLSPAISSSTIYIGSEYLNPVMELIPNVVPAAGYNSNVRMTVRMDKLHNEDILTKVLATGRKVDVLIDRPLSMEFLKSAINYRKNIISLVHETKMDCPVGYVQLVRRLLPNVTFFTRETDQQSLDELRFKFFDAANIIAAQDWTKDTFGKEAGEYLNKSVDKLPAPANMWFKSSKYILSNGDIYLSYYHVKADLPLNKNGVKVGGDDNGFMQVVDDKDFWETMNHFHVITK